MDLQAATQLDAGRRLPVPAAAAAGSLSSEMHPALLALAPAGRAMSTILQMPVQCNMVNQLTTAGSTVQLGERDKYKLFSDISTNSLHIG